MNGLRSDRGAVDGVWEQVECLTRRCVDLWYQTSDDAPDLGPTYSLAEQREREAFLDRSIKDTDRLLRDMPSDPDASLAWQGRLLGTVESVLRDALGFGSESLDIVMRGGLTEVGLQFGRAARRFDPAMNGDGIFQAGRNAWVMNSVQMALGLPVSLTPAMFGYSMLYPYTDNLLDDPRVPTGDKVAFNERFARRLAGQGGMGSDRVESAVDALVGMVEWQYPRERYPQVYGALLAIHRAQCHSLALHREGLSPYQVDVLGISCEKGGASVLADAYLVNGDLDEAQAVFAFGLGVYLQLADDLQDVSGDRRDGILTVYSQTAGRWPLDRLVNRLLTYSDRLLVSDGLLAGSEHEALWDLLRRSSRFLIIGAAAREARWFGRDHIRRLERHFPARFGVLRRWRRRVARQYRAMMRAVERSRMPALTQPLPPGPLAEALAVPGVCRRPDRS